MAQILGRAFIHWNGMLLRTKKGSSKAGNIAGMQRNEVIGDAGIDHSEELLAPFVETTVLVTADLNIMELLAAKDAVITFEGDNGKTLVLHEAHQALGGDLSSDSGELETKWVGSRFEEN
ncbi:MAG: phage tail tube protein [Gammaproteobacteria bacterium]|nr:phage tail tube protein [Gammaproteobacteria bacterium]